MPVLTPAATPQLPWLLLRPVELQRVQRKHAEAPGRALQLHRRRECEQRLSFVKRSQRIRQRLVPALPIPLREVPLGQLVGRQLSPNGAGPPPALHWCHSSRHAAAPGTLRACARLQGRRSCARALMRPPVFPWPGAAQRSYCLQYVCDLRPACPALEQRRAPCPSESVVGRLSAHGCLGAQAGLGMFAAAVAFFVTAVCCFVACEKGWHASKARAAARDPVQGTHAAAPSWTVEAARGTGRDPMAAPSGNRQPTPL